jgi:tRNA(Arg) A34 adenosine deaminase TadA
MLAAAMVKGGGGIDDILLDVAGDGENSRQRSRQVIQHGQIHAIANSDQVDRLRHLRP